MSAVLRWLPGVAAAVLYLLGKHWLGALRSDHVWLALGALGAWTAWRIGGRLRAPALFVAPLLIMALVYDAQGHWASSWRGPIHVGEPLALEQSIFGIRTGPQTVETPAHWWQSHTHPVLDALTGAGYLLFIPMFLALAAWWRWGEKREEAQAMMWAMLWLNLAAYLTYLLYAAAPPWYVDHYGLGPVALDAPPESAGAARFDALFGVTWFADFYGRSTNVFGAIPSLHVGQTFLAALYAWRFSSLRATASAFSLLVFFGSVYLNHHYIIDGVIGIAYALGAFAGVHLWRRRRA